MAAGAPPSTGAVPICRIGFSRSSRFRSPFAQRDYLVKKRGICYELLQIGRVSDAILGKLFDGSSKGILESVKPRAKLFNRVLSD